jgi:alpha-D-xyloside xylohydrolase
MFSVKDGALLRTCCGERLLVEPWGTDALRVRSTMHADFDREHWARDAERPPGAADIHISDGGESPSIRNGDILARIFWLDDGTPARPPRSFTQVWRSNFKR